MNLTAIVLLEPCWVLALLLHVAGDGAGQECRWRRDARASLLPARVRGTRRTEESRGRWRAGERPTGAAVARQRESSGGSTGVDGEVGVIQ